MLIELVIIFSVLVFFGIVIGVIFIFSKKMKSTIPPNSPLIVSFNSSISGGYALGVLLKLAGEEFNNRVVITMRPLDIKYNGSSPEEVEDVSFAVRKELIKQCPIGTMSAKRAIYFISPPSIAEINESFRNTDLGEVLTNFVHVMTKKDKAIELIKVGQRQEKQEIAMLEQEEGKMYRKQQELIDKLTEKREPRPIIPNKNEE